MCKKAGWPMRAAIIFFIIMAAGTVLSRAAASVLVAQVQVKKAGRGRLTYSYEGKGTVVPVCEEQIFLWPGLQVEKIRESGSTVKEGECLVWFRMEYLLSEIEKKEAEIARMELSCAGQEVSAREPARVPASVSAGMSLNEAQQAYAAAQDKTRQAKEAYEAFLGEMGGTADGSAEEGGSIQTDQDSLAAKRSELEAALREAEAGEEAARQTFTQAQNGYELALREDEAQSINAANTVEAARLGAAASQTEIQTAKKELEKLKAYEAAGGKLLASKELTVLTCPVQPGAVTTGSEVMTVGSSGFRLKGLIKTEDKEKLTVGAKAEVQLMTGKKKTVELNSFGVENGTADTGGSQGGNTEDSLIESFWYAPLPENAEAKSGDSFTWKLEMPSEKEYEQTIPLSALREGTGDTFCLILSEEKHMLGTVQTAKRVPVTVLEKDAESAAITSTLSDMDKVIVSSEKYVTEGDRVRVKE
ncbi:MAG: hypothetical protein K1W34_16825 [Lachnospiraceae bacterium]